MLQRLSVCCYLPSFLTHPSSNLPHHKSDDRLFSCNNIRKQEPHEGYKMIQSWRDRFFHPDSSPIAEEFKALHAARRDTPPKYPASLYSSGGEEIVSAEMRRQFGLIQRCDSIIEGDLAGPFFCYTSNVSLTSLILLCCSVTTNIAST